LSYFRHWSRCKVRLGDHIETVGRVKTKLGVNLTLGAKQYFLWPARPDLRNNVFVSIAIVAGVPSLIVDVAKVRLFVLAADLVQFIEHVELSYRSDFNQYYIEHMGFPKENLW